MSPSSSSQALPSILAWVSPRPHQQNFRRRNPSRRPEADRHIPLRSTGKWRAGRSRGSGPSRASRRWRGCQLGESLCYRPGRSISGTKQQAAPRDVWGCPGTWSRAGPCRSNCPWDSRRTRAVRLPGGEPSSGLPNAHDSLWQKLQDCFLEDPVVLVDQVVP